LRAQNPDTLTDLERAARFLYIQRLSFGGKVAGRTFGVSLGMPSRFDTTRLTPVLEAIHTRLSGVAIECLDWEAFITRWDRPNTLFSLDPPYYGHENDYGTDLFTPDQTRDDGGGFKDH
jgi:DNA adenine methylase